MGQRFKVIAAIVVSSALLASCTKFSMLAQPLEEPVAVEVRSLAEGGVLQPQDPLIFMIHAEQEEPYSLDIELADAAGRSLWQATIEGPGLNEVLSLDLTETLPFELSLGQYRLRFRVIGDNGVVTEKELDFFYAPGLYRVLSIHSFPPDLLPGASVRLQADLQVPPQANPFLRWTLSDTVIASGTLEEGRDKINLIAPATEGIYTVRLELFPVPPTGRKDYSFAAANYGEARLVVVSRQRSSESDLGPPERYYRLFHFNGDLKDSAPRRQPGAQPEATPIGNPQLVTVPDAVGYRLGPNAGLQLPEWLLPRGRFLPDTGAPEGDFLRPFTLSMGWILDPPSGKEEGRRALLELDSREGNFHMAIEDAPTELILELRSGNQVARFPSGFSAPADGREHLFSISVIPGPESVDVQWFLDGQQTAAQTRSIVLGEMSGAGTGRIGGSPGLNGIVTELGVYFQDAQGRPTTDARLYERAMERRYRQALIAAHGFDGSYPPEAMTITGPARLERGTLVLEGTATVGLPPFEAGSEGFTLDLQIDRNLPAGGWITLSEEQGAQPLLEIEISREQAGGLRLEAVPLESDPGIFAVMLDAGSRRQELRLQPAAGAASRLWLTIGHNPEDAHPLRLERLLLLQGRDREL